MTNTPNTSPMSSRDAQRAHFARAAVFAEFGRHARVLDQDDFIDRRPHELLRRPSELLSKLRNEQ